MEPSAGQAVRAVYGQAEVGAGVRGEYPGAADVGHDRDRAARRDRLAGEQRGGLDQVAEAVRGDDAGLLEQGFSADQRRGHGRGVRGRRALAGFRPPGFHGQDGHAGTDPAGRPGELARVAERLDVQHGELGDAVLFPPHQHVVAGDVELVAHRREGGDADAEPGQLIHQGDAQAAGLHDQPGGAGLRVPVGERGVQTDGGHGHAEAVRADQPHAVPTARRQQVRAGGGVEPGRDHHQGPHAALAALLRDVQDRRGRDRDHGQVSRLGQVEHRGQAVLAADLPGAGVDHVEPTGVPGGADVVQDRPAHRAPVPAGADHHDRFGGEHVPQAGRVGAAFPLGHGVQVAVQGGSVALTRQGKGHLHHPVLVVTLDRQAGVGEHLEHRGVLGQGLRGERGDLVSPGERDQVLEQQGGDAAVVHVIGHRERDLGRIPGAVRPGERVVAAAADHLAS